MTTPQLPESAPFSAQQRKWVNGFLAGLFSGHESPPADSVPPPSRGPLLFLWGSQTGGAEKLAKRFARESGAAGFDAKAVGLEAFDPADLTASRRVAIVTSTYGDGEMPDNAQPFWNKIRNGAAPRLDGLEFSVLALGDSNYVQFCEAGKLFDRRLEELGARRIHPRTDCDVDYKTPAGDWFGGLMKALGADAPPSPVADGPVEKGHGKDRPFSAPLLANRLLTLPGSAKEVRHIEIGLAGSGLAYEAGDALGVMPTNCPDFVTEILSAAGLRGSEPVQSAGGLPVRLLLQTRLDLQPFVKELPAAKTAPDDLVKGLRSLQPRLYSISSSPKAHPDEVHLTVGIVRYELDGRARKGTCSTFLADRTNGIVPVFVHSSPGFRLPSDPAAPVIMVGPGTGIAPFRAFLEERRAIGAPGRNWLFFGDQHAATDFLYREEIEAFRADGTLTRLDLAFSRDQSQKIYVQHRMLENAKEIWTWLQEGAVFYVCGDAKRMAKDVDAALHTIAAETGALGPDGATEFLQSLKSRNRYLRDVY